MNIFKKATKRVVSGVKDFYSLGNEPILPTVEDIHNEFDTASDRALERANMIISLGFNQQKSDLAKTLKDAGFTRVGFVQKISEEVQNVEFEQKRANIVLKYKEKYPQYKFIFKDQIISICTKYGLIFGPAKNYKGFIPVKNIEDIAKFKVEDEDIWYTRNSTLENWGTQNLKRLNNKDDFKFNSEYNFYWRTYNNEAFHKVPFYIAAPFKDMELERNQVVKGNEIVNIALPDPIVLHWVKDGFLVVTKWGLEAEDELLKD
jgi:hypothetical protein